MPIIPAMTLANAEVDAEEIYKSDDVNDGGLYDPTAAYSSLESLNGLLNKENFNPSYGAPKLIQPWMCQLGTFARGYYYGSDRWDIATAGQLAKASTTVATEDQSILRKRFASLSTTVFFPYLPTVVLYGFQVLFRHDATVWDYDGSAREEFWDFKATAFSNEWCYGLLPATRGGTQISTHSGSAEGGANDPGRSNEHQFKWIEKSDIKIGGVSQRCDFSVDIGCDIRETDQLKARCVAMTCAAWILALR